MHQLLRYYRQPAFVRDRFQNCAEWLASLDSFMRRPYVVRANLSRVRNPSPGFTRTNTSSPPPRIFLRNSSAVSGPTPISISQRGGALTVENNVSKKVLRAAWNQTFRGDRALLCDAVGARRCFCTVFVGQPSLFPRVCQALRGGTPVREVRTSAPRRKGNAFSGTSSSCRSVALDVQLDGGAVTGFRESNTAFFPHTTGPLLVHRVLLPSVFRLVISFSARNPLAGQ